MKKLALIILALLLLGCTQHTLTAEDIAKEMQKRYESIKDMSGEFVVMTNYGGKEETYEAKFWMKGNKYRGDDGKTLTVSNGSVMWIYDRERHEAVKINLSAERPQFDYGEIIEGLMESYNVKLLGEEKMNGRDCYVIEAEPKEGGAKMKIWVDQEFWYPMRTEMSLEGITTIVEYKNVSFNSGLSDDLFEFSPPENAKVVEKTFELPEKLTIEEAQRKVNFTIIVPAYTAGYEFDYAMVYNNVVQLHYGDLVITESTTKPASIGEVKKVKVKDRDAEIVEVFGQKILRIEIDGVWVTIAGLSEDELIKVAESMLK